MGDELGGEAAEEPAAAEDTTLLAEPGGEEPPGKRDDSPNYKMTNNKTGKLQLQSQKVKCINQLLLISETIEPVSALTALTISRDFRVPDRQKEYIKERHGNAWNDSFKPMSKGILRTKPLITKRKRNKSSKLETN